MREQAAELLAKVSDEPTLVTRNDYVKAVHSTLLCLLGVRGAREFWAQNRLEQNGVALTERELVEHVWNEQASSPSAWTLGLVSRLERFLIERAVNPATFADEARRFSNRGSFVQTRHLLSWLGPILVPLFRFGDPHRLLLHGARLVSSRMSPGVDFRIVPWQNAPATGAGNSGSVWLSYPGLGEGRIPSWDFAVHTGREMLVAPRIFGLPPFDALVMVCDARRAEDIPWLGSATRKGDRFSIDGKTYGRLRLLSEFLTAAGYDHARLAVPESKVVVADRDYFCSQRERAVIVAGCAYGASGYLARLHWRAAHVATKNFLWFAHTELDGHNDAELAQLAALHAEYVAAVTRSLTVTYFASDHSIEVGGRHVCRGTSAMLLRECVRIACEEGRLTFRFREFKRSPALISHPKNTGFETRLSRLRTALATAHCGVSIEPRGRGQFALVTGHRLEFVERHRVTETNTEGKTRE